MKSLKEWAVGVARFEDLYEQETAKIFEVDRSRIRVKAHLLEGQENFRVDVYVDGIHISDESDRGRALHARMLKRYFEQPDL